MITTHSDRLKNSNKRMQELEMKITRLTEKYEMHGQYLTGLTKEQNGLISIYKKIEEDLHDVSVHSHNNMDKIFRIQNNSFKEFI